MEVGQKYSMLTILSKAQQGWNCQCDCGNVVVVRATDLKSGKQKSCGCLTKAKEIAPQSKFNLLTVIEKAPGNGMWKCKCDCGNETIARGTDLRRGIKKSCGCLTQKNDLFPGVKKNMLTIIGKASGEGKWLCRCDCGNEIIMRGTDFRRETQRCCGCKTKELQNQKEFKRVWKSIK